MDHARRVRWRTLGPEGPGTWKVAFCPALSSLLTSSRAFPFFSLPSPSSTSSEGSPVIASEPRLPWLKNRGQKPLTLALFVSSIFGSFLPLVPPLFSFSAFHAWPTEYGGCGNTMLHRKKKDSDLDSIASFPPPATQPIPKVARPLPLCRLQHSATSIGDPAAPAPTHH
jgi:hypothetical protein